MSDPSIIRQTGIYILLRERGTRRSLAHTTVTALTTDRILAVIERAEAQALRKQLRSPKAPLRKIRKAG